MLENLMTTQTNRQFRLKHRPVGRVKAADFEFVQAQVPTPGAGEALVRVLYLSIDPTNRIWMTD
jgi:NADPH-dependent curcumin reductase